MRSLPRSLEPLHDESLPGFLLRLAHRLDQPPSHIAFLTGLSAGQMHPSETSHELMVRLDPAPRDSFARAAGLSTAEVDSLCLSDFGRRFPIPAVMPTERRGQSHRVDWWMFTTATRYCPQCLSGNGTTIERAHGGAWRRSWRLPITFACLRHQQLLRSHCPTCDRSAQGRPTGSLLQLVPAMGHTGLHPAQCRWIRLGAHREPLCGARLDAAPPAPSRLPDAVLILQRHLEGLLSDDGPPSTMSAGELTEPIRYFTDLRLVSQLVSMSWPAARQLAASAELAAAIDRHADQHRASQPHGPQVVKALAHSRPLDAAVSAGLLTIASEILACDEHQVRTQLSTLVPLRTRGARSTGWVRHFLRIAEPECSPGFRRAVSPLVRSFSRHGGQARRAPELEIALNPNIVPQRLPDDLFDQHLNHLDGVPRDVLRRTAAVRLVQMAIGGSLGAAAHFLGVRTHVQTSGHRIYFSGSGVIKWAQQRRDPAEFDAAVKLIADALTNATAPVDYRNRRDILHHWSLDIETWQKILRTSEITSSATHRMSDHDRQFASALVWARATQGEPVYAPQPIREQDALHGQRSGGCLPAWARRKSGIRSQTYTSLKKQLDIHADQLIDHLDNGTLVVDERR